MRTAQKIATGGLIAALAAAAFGVVKLGHPSGSAANRQAATAQTALVDQTPLKTAHALAQLADTPEEQELAKSALRLGDKESDLSFNIALQDAAAHPPELSPEMREIQKRLQKAQKLQTALQAQTDQLTAELAKAPANRKDALQDQLDLAKASLDVAGNDVDDAKRDLTDAGGNLHDRIEQMKQEHEEADKIADAEQKFPNPASEQLGIVHRIAQWSALNAKRNVLQRGKSEAYKLVAVLLRQHNALAAQVETEKMNSPDTAAHAKISDSANGGTSPDSAVDAATKSVRKTRTAAESQAALATTRAITADQRNLADFDKRIGNERELSETYTQWMDLVWQRQRAVARQILIGATIILVIALIGLFFSTWLEKLLGRTTLDQRQVQTLKATARLAVQVVAVLLILLVIFGPLNQLATFLGLAGAGLTVALKDFIVGFLGWFVLMRKNGIRLGDWVEINGVTGEVIEIGLFHTVLLETGNWTDSGHPTGRRVTFTNSYAIEGHYFNFSTAGQWLWDELQVVLPTGEDPYPMIDAIQKCVVEATQATAKEAAKELRSAAGNRDVGSFSAEPAISLRPVLGGIELSVRYITQANQRSQLRTKLNQAAVDLLGKRNVKTVSLQQPTPTSAS
jgi:hypothetical protein